MASCSEKESADSMPIIKSLTASPDTIDFGGDQSTITCVAEGNNLTYTWDVDLGDIVPAGQPGKVTFTGSPCCVGKKIIKCTVENGRGSVTDTVIVFIREADLK